MRTAVLVAAAGVLVLAAGGAYYGLEVYPQQRLRAGIDQTIATLPAGTTVTYKDAHYAVLSQHAVVTGVTVHGVTPGPSPQPFDVTIESIETTNPNLNFGGAWMNAAAHPASLAPDAAIPFADSIAVKGVTIHFVPENITEESFRTTKVRVYPWALLHDGTPAWKDIQASMAPRTQPPTLADLQPFLRAAAGAMLGIAYDGYEAGPMKIVEARPGRELVFAINRMTANGFDRGVINGVADEGMTFSDNTAATISVDRVAMNTADLRAPMLRLVNGEAPSAGLLDNTGIGRIEYNGITIQPPGKPPFHVGGFSMGPVAFAHGMPVSGALALHDFSISRSQITEAKALDGFTRLGLETITMSFALSYDWDVARQLASLHDTMLKVNELGTLTLTADLTNVVASVTALSQARLAHAKLRFEDATLVDRMLRAGAAMAGTDPAAYRQQIADIVRQQATATGGDSPLLAAAGQAAGDFITSPHSLTIELSPPTPVPFTAFMNAAAAPAGFAGRVGLAVSANQP